MASRLPTDAPTEIAAVIGGLAKDLPLPACDVLAIASIVCGREPSRQWVWDAPGLNEAVEAHRAAHKALKLEVSNPPVTTALQKARHCIQKLKAEIAQRDLYLDQYHELLMTHLKNARDHGLSQEQLERPLPKIVRSAKRSKKSKERIEAARASAIAARAARSETAAPQHQTG